MDGSVRHRVEGARLVKAMIGVVMVWAGYAVGIWGYCLVVGYDVPFTGLFGNTWPGGGQGALALPVDPGIGTSVA